MSNRRPVSRSGGAVADENKLQATCTVDDETVYAGSSSGRGSSCDSSLSSSDVYLYSVDSCGGGRDGCGGHYEKVGDDWASPLRLPAERHHYHGVYPKAESDQFIQTQSRWTTSSPLCGVSTLLTTCSLSSLAVCIALTGFSLTRIEPSRTASGATGNDIERNDDIANDHWIYGWAERLLLASPTDHRSSHQNNFATNSHARYSWDCVAQAGLAKCRPVHKVRSRRDGTLSSLNQPDRANATFYILVDGIYYVSVQMTGKVSLPPPTLLRAVVTRVKPKFGSVNMTTVHTITGTSDSAISAAVMLRGTFSVYTAAAVRLDAGDELLAHVVCVEDPSCIVHVNGTTSYLTLERLN